jgi:hypothetical protein
MHEHMRPMVVGVSQADVRESFAVAREKGLQLHVNWTRLITPSQALVLDYHRCD